MFVKPICNRPTAVSCLVLGLVTLHTCLLSYNAATHSPILYELGHIPAGLCHWKYQQFQLYRVNPPLPRMVATLPLLWLQPKEDWANYPMDPLAREEVSMGIRFAKANQNATLQLVTCCRWCNILFSLIGAFVVYRWASELWGVYAGLIAIAMWCFSPSVLGHGALVMPDIPAASVGLLASYAFWKWLKCPSSRSMACTGVLLGAALLCKTTLLLLLLLWPLAWVVHSIQLRKFKKAEACQLAGIIVLAVGVLNSGYFYVGTGQVLGDGEFISKKFTGADRDAPHSVGNRFTGSWIHNLSVPFPSDFVQGIDRQIADFEMRLPSYLDGVWSIGGWWFYYLVASAIKIPLGYWGIGILAIVLTATSREYRGMVFDESFLAVTAASIVMLVSSQTGLTNHFRYVFPALPFVLVWISKVGLVFEGDNPCLRRLVLFLLAWAFASSLYIYPHSFSYFNELVAGPRNGGLHLLDSNISCGQDLLYVKKWMEDHPQADRVRLLCTSWLDPTLIDIDFQHPVVESNRGNNSGNSRLSKSLPELANRVYIIDVNQLYGTPWPSPDGEGNWLKPKPEDEISAHFLQRVPDDRIGYSFYVYFVKMD
jgi:4-amino-4-deoxy-L-arabinose transferase-like glycosyltransferase